jgi:hypothetical protein
MTGDYLRRFKEFAGFQQKNFLCVLGVLGG